MSSTTKPHVALLASPGKGHLVPILELAKRLVRHHNLTATVFIAALENAPSPFDSDLLHPSSLPPRHLLDIILLPSTASSADPTANLLRQIRSMVRSTLPRLRAAISSAEHEPPTALIVDLFGTEAFKTADEFGMKKYVFFTSNAWYLGVTLYLPALDQEIKPDGEMKIPGCKPVRYDDLTSSIRAWGKPCYAEYARIGSEMSTADGILVNTWQDLEPSTIAALRENKVLRQAFNNTPVHLVGPVSRHVTRNIVGENRSGLLKWLDMQPGESVLYVSFGSGGTMSSRQTAELAWGLELSQQRFVWVIRPPLEGDVAGSLFGPMDGSEKIIARFVPDGFLIRTREQGRVLSMWAPQAEILAHPSTGGFLTHCGWNSVLEGLTNGVPLIAWPLYAEQNMNATLLTEEAKVAVRSEALPTKEVIGREEIVRIVRRVMVDKERSGIRERAKELQRNAEKALGKGGSSYDSLFSVAKECELHVFKG